VSVPREWPPLQKARVFIREAKNHDVAKLVAQALREIGSTVGINDNTLTLAPEIENLSDVLDERDRGRHYRNAHHAN